VVRRLKAALLDLRTIAPAERVPILEEQLELLATATARALDDDREVEIALSEDPEGIGAAASLERR
jgi:hypothetical protein